MKYLEQLRHASNLALLKFEGSDPTGHRHTTGVAREHIVKSLVQPFPGTVLRVRHRSCLLPQRGGDEQAAGPRDL